MSESEDPTTQDQAATGVTVEDIRKLAGASTPHFAMQIRNRIRRLIQTLPADHPARVEGEREIARLERLGLDGEVRGVPAEPGLAPLASVTNPR